MAASAEGQNSSLSDILLNIIVHLLLPLKAADEVLQYPATDPANATMRIALLQSFVAMRNQLRGRYGAMPSVQCWFSSLQRQNVLYLQKN